MLFKPGAWLLDYVLFLKNRFFFEFSSLVPISLWKHYIDLCQLLLIFDSLTCGDNVREEYSKIVQECLFSVSLTWFWFPAVLKVYNLIFKYFPWFFIGQKVLMGSGGTRGKGYGVFSPGPVGGFTPTNSPSLNQKYAKIIHFLVNFGFPLPTHMCRIFLVLLLLISLKGWG